MKKNSSLPNININSDYNITHVDTRFTGNNIYCLNTPNLFTDKLRLIKAKKHKGTQLSLQTSSPINLKKSDNENLYSNANFYKQNPILNEKIFGKNYYNIFEKMKNGNAFQNLLSQSQKNIFATSIYTSPKAMSNFFKKFHKFKMENRKNPLKINTPSLAFITAAEKEKIIPNPLGLIQHSESTSNFRNAEGIADYKLDLSNHKIGDSYAKALSSSLSYSEHINELILSSNRLKHGVYSILSPYLSNKKLLSKIKKINLSNNMIDEDSALSLISFLSNSECDVDLVDVNHCSLSEEHVMKICESIAKNDNIALKHFDVSANQIDDSIADSLTSMMKAKANTLRFLLLSNNYIHNKTATMIIDTMKSMYQLRAVDLSWNNIGDNLIKEPLFEEICDADSDRKRMYRNFEINEAQKSMKYIFKYNPYNVNEDKKENKGSKSVGKNNQPEHKVYQKIKIKIPPRTVSSFALALGEYFQVKNLSLIHLDISHNNIPYVDCAHLAESIKDNHSILGLHVDGNEMTLDSLGFISPLSFKKENFFSKSQLHYSMKDNKVIKFSKIQTVRKLRNKNNCWMCEGWKETEFIYVPDENLKKNAMFSIVKIHFDFDNYNHYDMIFNGEVFSTVRMCPHGDVHYFITVDTFPLNEYEDTVKDRQVTVTFDEEYFDELGNLKLKQNYTANTNSDDDSIVKTNIEFDTSKYNQIITVNTFGRKNIPSPSLSSLYSPSQLPACVDINYRSSLKFCVPRPPRHFDRFVKPRTPWAFPSSIWAKYDYSYEGYSDDYMRQCFEYDFNRNQFDKDFKDEESLSLLKEEIWKYYRQIIDCYKCLSSYSGFSIWQISQNVLTDWINKCNGLCDKKYDINNVYLVETGICANPIDKDEKKNGNKNLGENLVRHQFMALLVKVSKDKYIRTLKTISDQFEAFKYGMETNFSSALLGYDSHKWRTERYYNEGVDNLLQAYLPMLDGVYRSWSKQKGPRKKDVWMNLDEFNAFVCSFVDTNDYPVRDNPLLFNISIKLQVNEIIGDRHLDLMFPEFLEAMCRAVDKASPPPPGESSEEWPMQKRIEQPLVNKLENVIEQIVKMITHPDYKYLKDKFQRPIKDQATNLYVIDTDSNTYYQGYPINMSYTKSKGKVQKRATIKG